MSEITIPHFLVFSFVIALSFLIIIFINRKKLFQDKNKKWFWISVIVFLCFYAYILDSSIYDDIYSQWDLNKYDLNHDGFFTGNEITKSQELAMQRLANDIGRNYSFITGFVFSAIVAGVVYIIGISYKKVRHVSKKNMI